MGWSHPYGRGLGTHLRTILRDLADRGLPPLTSILVRKGERHPEESAIEYIGEVVGDIDIEELQRNVFSCDWISETDLAPSSDTLRVSLSANKVHLGGSTQRVLCRHRERRPSAVSTHTIKRGANLQKSLMRLYVAS